MLTLSFGKIVLVVLVVVAVWRGMKLLGTVRDKLAAEGGNRPTGRGRQGAPPPRATELFECPKCGVFVPNGTFCPSKEQCRFKRA